MAEDDMDEEAEGILLIDGILLGRILFPYAMAEVERLPPANDRDPPPQEG